MTLCEDEVRTRVRRLPPLPQAVQELRAALADEATGIDRVAVIVGADPALTMAALRVANSAFYSSPGRIATLRDAIQVLGLSTFASAVTTAAIVGCLGTDACPGFDVQGSWRHAVATALSSQLLAGARGQDGETAYVSGLLHDVGRLVLATHFSTSYAATLARLDDDDAMPLDVEREMLGIDHAEVGAMVASHWHLPTPIVEAIRRHHDVAGDAGHALLDVVHVADNVTYALGMAGTADEIVPPLSAEAWRRIGLLPAGLQTLFAQVEARMKGFGGGFAGAGAA